MNTAHAEAVEVFLAANAINAGRRGGDRIPRPDAAAPAGARPHRSDRRRTCAGGASRHRGRVRFPRRRCGGWRAGGAAGAALSPRSGAAIAPRSAGRGPQYRRCRQRHLHRRRRGDLHATPAQAMRLSTIFCACAPAVLSTATVALPQPGVVDEEAIGRLLAHPFFAVPPPKSLDRNDFREFVGRTLDEASVADGAATLTALTAAAVARIVPHLPRAPKSWIVSGGGAHNPTLMRMLGERLAPARVESAHDAGWSVDALEAPGFRLLGRAQLARIAALSADDDGGAAATHGWDVGETVSQWRRRSVDRMPDLAHFRLASPSCTRRNSEYLSEHINKIHADQRYRAGASRPAWTATERSRSTGSCIPTASSGHPTSRSP